MRAFAGAGGSRGGVRSAQALRLGLVFGLLASACGPGTTSVALTPASATLVVGQTLPLSAVVKDGAGQVVAGAVVTWQSSAASIATVSAGGVVTAVAAGSATVTASSSGAAATSAITVNPPAAPVVASLAVSPKTVALEVGGTAPLTAVARDGSGAVIAGAAVVWTTSDATVAMVSAAGVVTAVAPGNATVTATSGAASDTSTIQVTPARLVFTSLANLQNATCGLAKADGSVYCWGRNIAIMANGLMANDEWLKPRPLPITQKFASLVGSIDNRCGLDAAGLAYCWGANLYGELGNGNNFATEARTRTPEPVAGGHVFTELSAGQWYVCGATATEGVLCWGDNDTGQLGIGPGGAKEVDVPTPVAAPGGVPLTRVHAGQLHTCAVASTGDGYCWGYGGSGVLGTGGFATEPAPAKVLGGLQFASLSIGSSFTCGLTTAGAAWCWGSSPEGFLGNSALPIGNYTSPQAVSGGHLFKTLTSGFGDTCASTAGVPSSDNKTWCWGQNWLGAVGDGSKGKRPDPVPVSGDSPFVFLTMSRIDQFETNCGLTATGDAWCWGVNGAGQTGVGHITDPTTPELPGMVVQP